MTRERARGDSERPEPELCGHRMQAERDRDGFNTLSLASLLLEWAGSRESFVLSGFVLASGGVSYFSDELFEDVFEGDHALRLAVLVDEPGKV